MAFGLFSKMARSILQENAARREINLQKCEPFWQLVADQMSAGAAHGLGLKMSNSDRSFVDAVKKYCAGHGIAVETRSHDWLLIMRRGPKRHFAFGYDLGLNSAVAHRIANDKAATAEALQFCGVPCVPHALILNPELNAYVAPSRPWETMLQLLKENPGGLVVKPNEGTSGELVFMVSSKPDLELAAHRIFSANSSLVLSPYLEIENEVRVVLLDHHPLIVYDKNRPSIVGDGKHSILELALAATPVEWRSTVLPGMVDGLDRAALDRVLPAGRRQLLHWRHNLDSGAQPILLEQGAIREACVEIAINAAKSIGIHFGSIDVVQVDGSWQILEINSGVMMEALGRQHPDLVYAVYEAALDRVFG